MFQYLDFAQIATLVGASSVLGSLVTIWINFRLDKARTKDKVIQNSLGNIRRILYLVRMAKYVRYECEIYQNRLEALHRITNDTFYHRELVKMNALSQPYADKIYKLYGELHSECSKLERYLSKDQLKNLNNIFDLDNYTTLSISNASSTITEEEVERYTDTNLAFAKNHINVELKTIHNNYYATLASYF